MKTIVFGAAVLLACLGATPTLAADLASPQPEPAAPVETWNPWLVRLRAVGVIPNDGSKIFAAGALVPGASSSITNSVIPELDISYFFTPNIAAELVLGTTPHRAEGDGTLSALGKLGSVWLLPPTLTLQYHFTNFGPFKPYVGAGINYTIFYHEKDAALTDFRVKNSFGVALQVGADYMVNEHWGVNVDVKKLFLRPEATGMLGATPVKDKLRLDPWLIGAGVTYKF